MAGTNQFRPFATGVGSQVLTPSQWDASNARANGFVDGIADTASCNTAWRQSSEVAAMIGQFIVDVANLDANDDGNIAALETNFRAAINVLANAAAAGAIPASASLWHTGDDGSVTAGVISATVTPAITAYGKEVSYRIKANQSCTGSTSVNFNGLASRLITRADGTSLQRGDYAAGQVIDLVDDGTKLQLVGVLTSSLPSSAILPFLSTQNYTVPAGVTKIKRIRLWGGGGGGGGSSGSNGAGSGGGGGGYAEVTSIDVTPGQLITVTVGAAGTGGINGDGTNGGASSVAIQGQSAFATATGGSRGFYGNGAPQQSGAGNGGTGMSPGLNVTGGGASFALTYGSIVGSGIGGAGAFGGGPPTPNIGVGASSGNFPGGGSNGGSGGSNGGLAGGGLVILEI